MDIYYKTISESGKQMINYVCKYAPVELFKGFGQECAVLEEMPESFDKSDKIAHANLCGFGKSVIQAVLEGKVEELVLVNCCDSPFWKAYQSLYYRSFLRQCHPEVPGY